MEAQEDKTYCNAPCDSTTCPYSMYAVPTDGSKVALVDMSGTDECKKCDK